MKVAGRFLSAELIWAFGIFLLMVPVALLDNDPPSSAQFIRWFARAMGLAAFPAGIAIAPAVFRQERMVPPLLSALAAACVTGLVVFALLGVVMPIASGQERSIPQLLAVMGGGGGGGEDWERRNDAAWDFYTMLFAPLNTVLFAAIGLQVGLWAKHSLPRGLRRALYWVVGLGLLISGFAIWDTTYETIVLRTAADASFAAFYTILIPMSICAGLALPTLALLRRDQLSEAPGIAGTPS